VTDFYDDELLYDEELGRTLRDISAEPCDTEGAFFDVEARVRRIRRRRVDAVAGALLVALVVGLGLAARSVGHTATERPASVVTDVPPVTHKVPASVASTARAHGRASPAPATSGAPAPVVPTAAAPAPATVSMPPATTSASTAPRYDTPAAAPASTAPAMTDAGKQQTFEAWGGEVVVRVANGSLALVASAPRTGYVVGSTSTGPTHVQVEFRSSRGSSSIRLDLVNGQIQRSVSGDPAYPSRGVDPGHTTTSVSTNRYGWPSRTPRRSDGTDRWHHR
jgi:hypothetical protein